MFSHSLLLVLLVLTCIQSFTTAQNTNGPTQCCFRYQSSQIPVKVIIGYEETDHQCTKPGVIFILKSGRGVCADPEVKWVQKHMKTIDQRLILQD
ncbi:C-C motif chemokine 3-like isoform X2 [Pangasianodon hypophthalmus]|uniref:C-C motif chemokine 3-like isoform X2 n=1 Tax=Pangasianodon hypophthalmus TaxID=310915 RepID=UPI002307229B|nr:C-C motif chemokine 3-like isoform X2 [Pangasianodon hypophthalmus]